MKNILSRIDGSYIYSFLGEATLGLTFVLYIILGRVLGPEQYGVFTAANALAGILTFFMLFGLPDLLLREIAADPEEGPKSTTTFLLIEGFNCLVILLLLLPIATALGFEGSGILVCYLVVVGGGCRCAKQTLRSVFRGLGQFRSETISVTIERLAFFAIASAVLFLTHSLVWVVGAMAVVRLLDAVGLFYYLNRKAPISAKIELSSFQRSLKMAYPFALSGVLWVLYYQVDMVMLKVLAPAEEAGFYGAAYSLIEIFSALPRVIFYVAFPRLTRCYATDPGQLPAEIKRSTVLLLAIALPFITIAGFSQTLLIKLSYGEAFLPAIGSLAILLPSLSMKMFASLVSKLFQATRRENLLPSVLLVTVCINVVANAIMIPHLGAVGAALATLLSEIIFSIVGLVLVIRIGYGQIGKTLLAVAIISLLVASIPSFMLYGLNAIVAIGMMAFGLAAIPFLMYRQSDRRI
ncbi:MAG: flippase [Phormidesmis sp.]